MEQDVYISLNQLACVTTVWVIKRSTALLSFGVGSVDQNITQHHVTQSQPYSKLAITINLPQNNQNRTPIWTLLQPTALLTMPGFVGEAQKDLVVQQNVLNGNLDMVYISPENIICYSCYQNMLLTPQYKEHLITLVVALRHPLRTVVPYMHHGKM